MFKKKESGGELFGQTRQNRRRPRAGPRLDLELWREGFPVRAWPPHLFCEKGSRSVSGQTSNSQESLTVLACRNAAGGVLSPWWLWKARVIRVSTATGWIGPGIGGCPWEHPRLWKYQEKGWMTNSLVKESLDQEAGSIKQRYYIEKPPHPGQPSFAWNLWSAEDGRIKGHDCGNFSSSPPTRFRHAPPTGFSYWTAVCLVRYSKPTTRYTATSWWSPYGTLWTIRPGPASSGVGESCDWGQPDVRFLSYSLVWTGIWPYKYYNAEMVPESVFLPAESTDVQLSEKPMVSSTIYKILNI
jgi:hypothetical protein